MTPIQKQKTNSDVYRESKVGKPFQVSVKQYQNPHAIARYVGIKVKTKVIQKKDPSTGLMVIEVTRIPNVKKKGAK